MGTNELWVPNGDGSESLVINGRKTLMRWPDGRWRREDDPYGRRFMTNGTDGAKSIADEEVFNELRQIIIHELRFTRDEHLVRLTVEIALCS